MIVFRELAHWVMQTRQFAANCVGDELKATVNAQLGQDVLDMVADRGRADVEALRDRPAGGASGEEVDNLRLASRERMEAGLGQG
jgi:hypothetical protein